MLLNESEMYAQVSNLIVFKRFPGSADLPTLYNIYLKNVSGHMRRLMNSQNERHGE